MKISPYTILDKVHEGPSTALYRGHRDTDGAPVVAKVLLGEHPPSHELAKLRNEYELLKSIDFPGIAKAQALQEVGNGLALILEQLKGRPLSAVIAERRLPIDTVLHVAVSLADTLEFLHRENITHRDIKPQNIFIDLETQHVVLTDFATSTRMNRGIDGGADFYSLGVTMYELLTGALPFTSLGSSGAGHGRMARVPPGLSALVMKLLEKSPENCYQSAAGLKADLLECQKRLAGSGEIADFALGRQDRREIKLDAALVMRAAHAIASELLLDKVLDQLMRISASHAGAQRGFVVLDRSDRQGHASALMLTASIDADSDQVAVDLSRPVESCGELSASIVQLVAGSCQPVVLDDASAEPRFFSDPYIASRRPKSLICLPLLHRSRLTGVIYLENNGAAGVFTAERSELLQLLSPHAATAIENALLYSNAQDIIREKNARLAEMSTPIIPITEKIMVMPLIGTMDTQRANQVLETALQGAQSSRAQVVIIDITGMKHVDTNVAAALIKAGTALRLLGAQALLTGIRAEVAQTLVGLGVDMSSVVTSGTLQSGIAHALRISGSMSLVQKIGKPLDPAFRRGSF